LDHVIAEEANGKKGGRHVATAALSLGRKRPRRAYAAGHAAPQQYRRCPPHLQDFSSQSSLSPTEFAAGTQSGTVQAHRLQIDLSSYNNEL
jgi:hypothetical protein